jgi:hypothetical protein
MNKQEIEILKEVLNLIARMPDTLERCKEVDILNERLDALKPQQTKGTRLPDDWELPLEWGEWALGEGYKKDQILQIAAEFKDFWIAKSGKDAVKANWFSTWKNWIRRQK